MMTQTRTFHTQYWKMMSQNLERPSRLILVCQPGIGWVKVMKWMQLPLVSFNTMFCASLIYEHTANHLSEYDLAICRAFAYKVKTHTTNEDFAKVPYAFLTNPPLLK